MNVTLEDAYREACQALGETIIRERLLIRQIAEQQQAAASAEEESRDRPTP